MSSGNAQSTDIKGYVFVVTYGRSGSTLVQNLLNAIDGYCIRGENNNAVGPLARAWINVRDSESIRRITREGEPTLPENPWYGAEGVDHRRYAKALAAAFRKEVLAPPHGTRVAGFKEIRWGNSFADLSNTLNFLHRFLSPAKFIFNTRNHEEVCRSAWWKEHDPAKVKASLVQQEDAFKRYADAHPNRCHHIHYNEYVADHAALKPMYDFLGEPFDSQVVSRIMAKPLTHLKAGKA